MNTGCTVKLIKYFCLVPAVNAAAGILDNDPDNSFNVMNADSDEPLAGVFDSIVNEVSQDLTQANPIAQAIRFLNIELQANPLTHCFAGKLSSHLCQQRSQINLLQLRCNRLPFNLGQINHAVEQFFDRRRTFLNSLQPML